jgi:hypothetical protein
MYLMNISKPTWPFQSGPRLLNLREQVLLVSLDCLGDLPTLVLKEGEGAEVVPVLGGPELSLGEASGKSVLLVCKNRVQAQVNRRNAQEGGALRLISLCLGLENNQLLFALGDVFVSTLEL